MEPAPSIPITSLRRLARGLLYDEHRAEDVVQEAWLAALQKRPPEGSLASWMRTAVRHLALNVRRESERRSAREACTARPVLAPDGNEVLAQVEVLQRVLATLAELDEPYRTAVGLRYLEGHPPRTIAKNLGLPVNTVRTHVRRGLAELRRKLEHGTRREDLLAALAPLAGRQPWHVPPQKLAIAGAAVLVTTTTIVWLLRPGSEPLISSSTRVSPLAKAQQPTSPDDPSRERAREPLGPSTAVEARWAVRGRALRGSYGVGAGLPLRARLFAGYRKDAPVALEATLTSGADGRFEWELDPPTTSVRIEVAAADAEHSAKVTSANVPHGEFAPELFVRAYPLDAEVTGVLRTSAGEPVAGGRLVLADQSSASGADGRFRLRTSSEHGPQRLWATASDRGAAQVELAPFVAGEARALDLTLGRERIYRGTIVDEQGMPIEGVEVASLWHAMLDAETGSTRTDADGRYELRLDDQEPWHSLQVNKPGFAPSELSTRGNRFEEAPLVNEGIDCRLLLGATVTGRVLTSENTPLSAAMVYLHRSGATHMVESGADGRFALEHVPTDASVLGATRAGYGWTRLELAENRGEVTLVLTALADVAGRVIDADGNGIAFAEVEGAGTTFADEAGNFLAKVEPGKRVLRIQAPGWTSLEASPEASPFVLQPRGTFAGCVIDATTGAPVPDFTLTFFDAEDTSTRPDALPPEWRDGVHCGSPDGTWRLAAQFPVGLRLGVEVRAAGYMPTQDLDIVSTRVPEPESCVLALYRTTSVRGVVVSLATELPLAGVEVFRSTSATRRGTVDGSYHAMTDELGRFELRDVPAGMCYLGVRRVFQYAAKIDGPFEVGAQPVERRIELFAGATLSLRLLDEHGKPLADREILVRGTEFGDPMNYRTRTNATGACEVHGLSSGEFDVGWLLWANEASPPAEMRRPLSERSEQRAFRTEAHDLVERVMLVVNEHRELVLRPNGTARIQGTLTCDIDLPDIVPITFTPLDDDAKPLPRQRATLADHGAFELPWVDAGSYLIEASFPSLGPPDASGTTRVTVGASDDTRISLHLERL